MRIVEYVLGLERRAGVIPVCPDSGFGLLRLVLDFVGEKVAKPYTARIWMLPCLCGSTIQPMDNKNSNGRDHSVRSSRVSFGWNPPQSLMRLNEVIRMPHDVLAATGFVLILRVYQVKSRLILLSKANMSVPQSRLQAVSLVTLLQFREGTNHNASTNLSVSTQTNMCDRERVAGNWVFIWILLHSYLKKSAGGDEEILVSALPWLHSLSEQPIMQSSAHW